MTDFPTGWARDLENTEYLRKGGLRFAAPQLLGDVPEEFDTRPMINTENQLATSSCVGHATSSCIEACAWIAAKEANEAVPEQFSRWFAYLQAQKQGGMLGRDNGATMSGAAQAMKLVGCCKESTLPFPGRYVTTIPRGALDEASQFKIRSHASLSNYKQVFDFMAGGFGATIIGVAWTSRLANSTGVVELADVKGQGGGHALCLWGWSKRKDEQGRHYLWMHNSHGKTYGNNGRVEVAPSAVDFWGASRNNEMIGLSDLTGFDRPRVLVPDISEVM
jgi:C1A family cysteine protease